MMDFNQFSTLVQELFPSTGSAALERFEALDGLYRDWNGKINVISRKDMDSLYCHHVLHSLAIAAFLRSERPRTWERWVSGGSRVLDLGTGGGFPGIPLAILFPDTGFTLCDSIGKKTKVASEVARALSLGNVTTVNARAESLGRTFDHVVTRAVASLSDLYPWVKGSFRESILCLKGGDIAAEAAALCGRHSVDGKLISPWKIPQWDPEGWFEGKYVVEIRSQKAK